jgi:hypothetical protein
MQAELLTLGTRSTHITLPLQSSVTSWRWCRDARRRPSPSTTASFLCFHTEKQRTTGDAVDGSGINFHPREHGGMPADTMRAWDLQGPSRLRVPRQPPSMSFPPHASLPCTAGEAADSGGDAVLSILYCSYSTLNLDLFNYLIKI